MSVVQSDLLCIVCNQEKQSCDGKFKDNNFNCFDCITLEKQNKQTMWIAALEAEKTIIMNALTTLENTDVLNIIDCTTANRIILDSQRCIQDFILL